MGRIGLSRAIVATSLHDGHLRVKELKEHGFSRTLGSKVISRHRGKLGLKASKGLIEGTFIERPNRFLALVEIGSDRLPCFLPNPGRMEGLLIPGKPVLLRRILKASNVRKTNYDLVGVRLDNQIVSLDSRLPNKFVWELLKARALEAFSKFTDIEPEYSYGGSRLDFLLKGRDGELCLLEVKSCTLVKNRRGLFPDAPTERGRRHLESLIAARKEGYRASVIFIIQRVDVEAFSPNDEVDPKFGKSLRKAISEGVEAYAYTASFDGFSLSLVQRIPIKL
ncbi:DNA/RNA nuclease SfsA [Candidatus Bathyarchaeota archaeon]|nr:DNA/RNA nuclease SfsA [Candidatus Bathyarchaeota archaeon]MBS7627341.1 DNA/RNA nuclease SfsA [Candidatus Bathyarchaeota archaeon]